MGRAGRKRSTLRRFRDVGLSHTPQASAALAAARGTHHQHHHRHPTPHPPQPLGSRHHHAHPVVTWPPPPPPPAVQTTTTPHLPPYDLATRYPLASTRSPSASTRNSPGSTRSPPPPPHGGAGSATTPTNLGATTPPQGNQAGRVSPACESPPPSSAFYQAMIASHSPRQHGGHRGALLECSTSSDSSTLPDDSDSGSDGPSAPLSRAGSAFLPAVVTARLRRSSRKLRGEGASRRNRGRGSQILDGVRHRVKQDLKMARRLSQLHQDAQEAKTSFRQKKTNKKNQPAPTGLGAALALFVPVVEQASSADEVLGRVGLTECGEDAQLNHADLAELMFERELEEAARLGLEVPAGDGDDLFEEEEEVVVVVSPRGQNRRVTFQDPQSINKFRQRSQRVKIALDKLRLTVALFKHSRTDPDTIRSALRWNNKPTWLEEFQVAVMHLPHQAFIRLMMCCADVSSRLQLDILIDKGQTGPDIVVELRGEADAVRMGELLLRQKAEAVGTVTTDMFLKRRSLHSRIDFTMDDTELSQTEVEAQESAPHTQQGQTSSILVTEPDGVTLTREELTYIACTIDKERNEELRTPPVDAAEERRGSVRLSSPHSMSSFKPLRERAVSALDDDWDPLEDDRRLSALSSRSGGSMQDDTASFAVEAVSVAPAADTAPLEEQAEAEAEAASSAGNSNNEMDSTNGLSGAADVDDAKSDQSHASGMQAQDDAADEQNESIAESSADADGRSEDEVGSEHHIIPMHSMGVTSSQASESDDGTLPDGLSQSEAGSRASGSHAEEEEEDVPSARHTPTPPESVCPAESVGRPESRCSAGSSPTAPATPAAAAVAVGEVPCEVVMHIPYDSMVEIRHLILPPGPERRQVVQDMLLLFGGVTSVMFDDVSSVPPEVVLWRDALKLGCTKAVQELPVPDVIRATFDTKEEAEAAVRHLHAVSIIPGLPLLHVRHVTADAHPNHAPFRCKRKPKWGPGDLHTAPLPEGSWEVALGALHASGYADYAPPPRQTVKPLEESLGMYRERVLRSKRMQQVIGIYATSLRRQASKESVCAAPKTWFQMKNSCGGMMPSLRQFAISTTAIGRTDLEKPPRFAATMPVPPTQKKPVRRHRHDPYLMHPTQCFSRSEQQASRAFVKSYKFKSAAPPASACQDMGSPRSPIPPEWMRIGDTQTMPPSLGTPLLPSPEMCSLRIAAAGYSGADTVRLPQLKLRKSIVTESFGTQTMPARIIPQTM